MKPTQPGERRHLVNIQDQLVGSPPTLDAAGSPESTWTTFISTWAKINPNRARDVIQSGQTTTQTFLVLNIRYRAGILANMRVQWTNGTYVIQGIENIEERNQELNLICLALGANE
jgi:SPP1 family predicted phage head-tail adaptor